MPCAAMISTAASSSRSRYSDPPGPDIVGLKTIAILSSADASAFLILTWCQCSGKRELAGLGPQLRRCEPVAQCRLEKTITRELRTCGYRCCVREWRSDLPFLRLS